jgi:dihydroxyacetone kinase-like protein
VPEGPARLDAALARAWMLAMASAVERERERLTELDSAIGDGDHGTNLQRGFRAVAESVLPEDGAGAVLVRAGALLISTVGGASGPLYGSALRAMGKALGAPADTPAEAARVGAALAAGLAAVTGLGGARPGDKTMVDAWAPAAAAFEAAAGEGEGLGRAARAAAEAAEKGAWATVPLRARKGRASYLGERSEGHQDPGAASTALLFRALAEAVTD